MGREFRLLKRESRILALSGTSSRDFLIIVGVVYRGSLWLDGTVTARIRKTRQSYDVEISYAVKSTKQFAQLHAIILSKRLALGRKLSSRELSKRTKLPVLALTEPFRTTHASRPNSNPGLLSVTIRRMKRHVAFTGVPKKMAEQLYRIGCRYGMSVPEPVRVADLLAKQLALTQVSSLLRTRRPDTKTIKA